ncbi:lysophospholipase [Leptolyngbya sp. PCC 7375]|nr:lysophospholipase [Leptolyngbya sp. PCC 7375]
MALHHNLSQGAWILGWLTIAVTDVKAEVAIAPTVSPVATEIVSAIAVSRTDFRVESDPGIEISVREVKTQSESTGVPILLIHGGGPGGLASFDLEVPDYSLAADFAQAGHPVYVMNVRGWEDSTRPDGLDEPADRNPPLVTSEEAVRDIGAVVDWIRDRTTQPQVALVGWATGGHWAGMYTSRHNDVVSHLIMLNSLYSVNAPWVLTERFEDPNNPGSFNPDGGAYRLVDYDGFLRGWDNSIPIDDKPQWRDPAVADAYARTAVELDPTSATRTPPSARIPTAYREESFNLAQGYRYWNAEDIYTPTLGIRGELDFWSRPEDLSILETELINAPVVQMVTIPDATHYLFNDRPERGRERFIQEVLIFLLD